MLNQEYTTHGDSIESFFYALAVYIHAHWVQPGWWGEWNCGIPFRHTYQPGLHIFPFRFSVFSIPPARSRFSISSVNWLQGLTRVPLALLLLHNATERRSLRNLFLAALGIVAVPLVYIPATLTLAMAVLAYLLSVEPAERLRRALVIAACSVSGYLLAAPPIPLSALLLAATNTQGMEQQGRMSAAKFFPIAAGLLLLFLLSNSLRRLRVSPFARFAIVFSLITAIVVLGKTWGNFSVIAQPTRFHLATYEIGTDDGAGSRAAEIALSGPRSTEIYHVTHHPDKFNGILTPLWHDGDDAIHEVPGPQGSLAHWIQPGEVIPQMPVNGVEVAPLQKYVAALSDPQPPASPPALGRNRIRHHPRRGTIRQPALRSNSVPLRLACGIGEGNRYPRWQRRPRFPATEPEVQPRLHRSPDFRWRPRKQSSHLALSFRVDCRRRNSRPRASSQQ